MGSLLCCWLRAVVGTSPRSAVLFGLQLRGGADGANAAAAAERLGAERLAGGDGVLDHSLPLRLKPGLSSRRMVAVSSLTKAVCPQDTEGSLTWGVWAQGWGG